MAELPPKIPSSSMTTTYQNKWPPAFPPHQRMPPLTNTHGAMMPGPQPPSWVDEFLDFAAARRGSHRRSMSDSVAFHGAVPHALHGGGSGGGFDRLDDEQLMSMFNDDDVCPAGKVHLVGPRRQPPSSPSDQNSNNEDEDLSTENNNNNYEANNIPKSEPGEVESTCEKDELNSLAPPNSNNANQPSGGSDSIDPKRIKRILANRQSAQRSRVRKLHYISELERSVTTLQTEVSVLSPRVAFLDHQRLIMNVDNSALKQRIAALAQDKIFKDAHQEALKKEIERLRHIYQQQQNMKMNTTTNNNNNNCGANNATATPKPSSDLNMGCTDKEQLMA